MFPRFDISDGPLTSRIERFAEAQTYGTPPPRELLEAAEGGWGSPEAGHATVSGILGIPPTPTADAALKAAFAQVFGALTECGADNGDLVAEVMALHKRIEARLADQRKARIEGLAEKHAEVYSACRVARDEMLRLQKEHATWTTNLQARGEKLSQARLSVKSALARRPKLADFPTAAEFEAWREEVRTTEATLRELEEPAAAVAQKVEALASELAAALEQFERLRTEEENLRLFDMQGRPRPVFGLQGTVS